jgi:hypothetical protein
MTPMTMSTSTSTSTSKAMTATATLCLVVLLAQVVVLVHGGASLHRGRGIGGKQQPYNAEVMADRMMCTAIGAGPKSTVDGST